MGPPSSRPNYRKSRLAVQGLAGARARIDPTALYRALGAWVARQGMCGRHATLGAQQNPRHCGVPGRTAGVEEARSRGQDEKIESSASARVACAWPGEERGKLSGREIRTWAGDTSYAGRMPLPWQGACAGGAVARRGVVHTCSCLVVVLSRSQREDARMRSMSYRPPISTQSSLLSLNPAHGAWVG